MRKVRVEDAIGMELCHDVTAMRDGFKGPAFRRGHVVTEEDVPRLLDLGKRHVFIWEPGADEVHEEDAALRLAALFPVEGARWSPPSEGKVVLTAERAGMSRVDTELLRDLNSIGDITICTLPDHYPVEPGARLASMRIVPLVTQEAQLARAEELCRGRRLLDLLPYRHLEAGIIVTGSEVYSGRVADRFEPVARAKLARFPCEVLGVTLCDDDTDMLVGSIRGWIERGAGLVVLSGGMSVDPDDVTPQAIAATGADVVSWGVPAQPGNMTMLAYLGDVAIIGVPGAAISMPTTIFDVLLPQVFTGVRFTKADLVRLGEGGLCQLCATCHRPCCTFGRY